MKLALLFIFLFLALERILNTFGRKEPEGKIKYRLLTYLLIFTYNLAVAIALWEFINLRTINIFVSVLGFLIMLLGVFLRRGAIKALGKNWSIHIKEIIGQELVKSGPYRYLSHPYYLAVIFELIGVSLFFNASFALIFTLLVQIPLLLIRIRLEERLLIKQSALS